MVHRSDSELNLDFIVFEGRNHAYGAFDNRQKYNTRLKHSLIIVFFFCTAVFAIQIIFNQLYGISFIDTKPPEVIHVIETDIPMIEKPAKKTEGVKTTSATTNKGANPKPVITEKDPEVNNNPNQKHDAGTIISTGNTGRTNVDTSTSTGAIGIVPDITMEDKIVDYAEEMPEFPGGNEALSKFFLRNINFPEEAIREGIEGKVYISFIIGKAGEIRDVKLVKGLDQRCDEEALRVVQIMPKWKPGKSKGKFVSVKKIVPIVYKNNGI